MSRVFTPSKTKLAYYFVSGFMLNGMINCDNHLLVNLS